MSGLGGNYGADTDAQLLSRMRGTSSGAMDYAELKAELERRLAERQFSAARSQIWSAWLQAAAVAVMAATLAWTVLSGKP